MKLYQSFNFTFHHINDASSLDLHFEIASVCRLRTKLDDKWNYFNFPIVNFPSLCSNIPEAPVYGVYISLNWSDISELVVPIRICRVNLVANTVISHERREDQEVLATRRKYPWSFVTQIFHQPRSFFCWPLYCLFFDLPLLISPLESSNFS
jgi:hypothetical protein